MKLLCFQTFFKKMIKEKFKKIKNKNTKFITKPSNRNVGSIAYLKNTPKKKFKRQFGKDKGWALKETLKKMVKIKNPSTKLEWEIQK